MCFSRGGFVKEVPPLTKEEMATSSDEAVLESLRGPPHLDRADVAQTEVEDGWEQPGGSWSATQELGELVKENRARVLPLLPKLIAEGNESPVAHVLHELVATDLSCDEVFDLLRSLASLGPKSEDFRSDGSYLLYKRCEYNVGLPDDICEIIERWLSMFWSDSSGIVSRPEQEGEEDRDPTSTIWGYSGGLLDTDKSFFPLLAVTNGYLNRSPPDTSRWLKMLDQHLDRNVATGTWRNYCSEFRWIRLKGCDRDRGIAAIRKLFAKGEDIRLSKEGCRLIAMVCDLLPVDFVQDVLENLRASERFAHQQAFGELLTLIALRHKSHDWAVPLLEQRLEGITTEAATNESIAVGIAFAAARLWDEPLTRTDARRILCRLIPYATTKVATAIGTVFWAADNFPADSDTDSLLETLSEHPHVLVGQAASELIEHLAALLPQCRKNVAKVCSAIIANLGHELGSISHRLFLSGPQLVNIAMTLQRFDDTRTEGLSLLENLLRLGLDDAFMILHDIDIRPAPVRRQEPRPRRRRRK